MNQTSKTSCGITQASLLCTLILAIVVLLEYSTDLCSVGHFGSVQSSAPSHSLHIAPKSRSNASVTVVTAYYPLSQGSKHSLEEYRTWMANFLPYTRSPVVMFMPPDPELENAVRDLRGDLPLTLHKIPLWELPPIAPLEHDFKTWQHDINPEKGIHSPELYAIWTAKAWMVAEAAKKNAFGSEHFFWVDIGSWRDRPFPSWPDPERVKETFVKRCDTVPNGTIPCADRILLGVVVYQDGKYHAQGTFFGGSAAAVTWWADVYYARVQEIMANGGYAGTDQIIQRDLFYQYPDRCLILRSDRAPFGNVWWFFQPFFASPHDVDALPADSRTTPRLVMGSIEAHNLRLVMLGEDVVTSVVV